MMSAFDERCAPDATGRPTRPSNHTLVQPLSYMSRRRLGGRFLSHRTVLYSDDEDAASLERCLRSAGRLVAGSDLTSVIVLTGVHPVDASRLRPGIDLVRVPRSQGTRDSGSDIVHDSSLRTLLIAVTMSVFRPGLVLVDGAFDGLGGELAAALRMASLQDECAASGPASQAAP